VPAAVILVGIVLTLAVPAPTPGARVPTVTAPAAPAPAVRVSASDTLVFGAVGDMMLGSWLTPLLDSLGVDYPLAAVTPLLARADLLLGNLEAPFLADTTGVVRAEKTYTFAVPPRHIGVLTAAGIDVVTLANNHILDFGPAGLDTTRTLLEEAGIAHAGTGPDRGAAHRHVLVERAGRRVAVLAYNHVFPEEFWAGPARPGTAHADDAGLAREVALAATEADLVVVTFHWGAEGMETPKDYQRILAHIAIDHGADLVVGHHPHVLQPLEWYRGRLIAYSLGNFVFASYSEIPTGAVLLVRFEGEVPIAAEFHPLDVNNLRRVFRPAPVPAARWPRLGSAVVAALADSAAAGAPGVRIVPGDGFLLLPPIPVPSP
jgi:poly-gamma-glutamate capsule biosynthesis protein CapA/YwtB (metallophosphatase superfamily)